MSNQAQIRVVCFDLGGVLANIERTWHGAMKAAGLEPTIGIEVPITDFELLTPYQSAQINEATYLQGLAKYLKLDSTDLAKEAHNGILGFPYPDTKPIVDELRSKGIMTACLSNTSALHWDYFFTDRFPNIAALDLHVGSHILQMEKPDEAIYRAFEVLAEAKPHEILFFEDTPPNAHAAIKFGWNACIVDPYRPTAPQIREALDKWGL